MDSSLHEVWQAASGRPFVPAVGKDSQIFLAFLLVILGLGLSGTFTLSASILCPSTGNFSHTSLDRSFANLPLIGIPASLALAYVSQAPFISMHTATKAAY